MHPPASHSLAYWQWNGDQDFLTFYNIIVSSSDKLGWVNARQ